MPPRMWTNRSVLEFAGNVDPIQAITDKARNVAVRAIEGGWTGPPYDPFSLADYLKVRVVARQDIADARTVPTGTGPLIEFNPNRPKARIKYSICHELAHTFFPDCDERIRNRVTHRDSEGDDWQLEMLCNIGAAELLLPIGSTPELERERLDIDGVLEARRRHAVSIEAILLRAARITNQQCCVFSTSRRRTTEGEERYFLDYVVGSRSWNGATRSSVLLPKSTVASNCSVIGFTAKGSEPWPTLGQLRVECVGVPPYPNQVFPRVLGLAYPQKQALSRLPEITYLQGDATIPHARGFRIVAQLVNDSAFTWGAGFSYVVRKKWPVAQRSFREWAEADRRSLKLGSVHFVNVGDGIGVASMIAQHGYGPSPKPRIRYIALATCLDSLAELAINHDATVHMPKIGAGQAGGSWSLIREVIAEKLGSRGIKVFVYELPGAPRPAQPALQF
jgi:hypothetical protein